MVGIARHLVHTASWARKTGGSDWEGADHAEPVEIPCRFERSTVNRADAGSAGPRQEARIMVGPRAGLPGEAPAGMPDVGDRFVGEVRDASGAVLADLGDGEEVEAVDDQMDGRGAVVGRICRLEPS